ncbi:MAG: SHOCT domain-containing protein, partial [Armatimonadetes bacterium]|nr:SHOCT domain-containing protein [Armatimonadota bacterium]
MSTLYPTLVIGLGGTGKSILWDIRQRMMARFGSFRELPVIGFLGLDTDEAMDEELTGEDLLSGALSFAASEHLHLTVSSKQMKNIKENLGSHYPYLSSWLAPESLIHPSVVAGAGQIRQIGRLAFLVNVDKVQAAVNDSLRGVTSADSRTTTTDYLKQLGYSEVSVRAKPLRIYVVGSLIGGTGSGMFLDLGYLLQEDTIRVMVSQYQPVTTGIFVLPLAGKTRSGVDTRASAYASLTELNHYSDPDSTYEIQYPDGRMFSTHEPPYDFTFLVTTQSKHCTLDGPRSLTQMIGQRIFLEATSLFSSKIQSNRDNIRKHMAETDGRGCNQYFFTFGLSTMEVPTRAISSACGAMFMRDLIRDLRFGRYAGKESELVIDPAFRENFLQEHRLSEKHMREALLASGKQQTLDQALQAEFDAFSTFTGKSVIAQLRQLEKKVDEGLTPRAGEGGVDGEYVKLIEENATAQSGATESLLTRLITALARKPDRRILYAKKFLEQLKSHFGELKHKYNKKAQDLPTKIKRGDSAIKRGRSELVEIASDPVLAFSPWRKSAYYDAYTQRYGRDAVALTNLRIESVLCRTECMVGYLDEVARVVEQLHRRLESLDLFLEGLENRFSELARQARRAYVPVNGRVIYAAGNEEMGVEGEVEETYKRITDGRRDKLLQSFFDEIVDPMLKDDKARLDIFLLERKGVAASEMIEHLWGSASRKIREWGNLEKLDAVETFLRDTNYDNEFKRIAELSSPFLDIHRGDNKFEDTAAKQQTMVGFHGAARPTAPHQEKFKQLCETYVDGVAGHTDEKLIHLEDTSQVVFYREYGAFPVRLWTHGGAMRQAYERQERKSKFPLHLQQRGFPFIPVEKAAREDVDSVSTLFLVAITPGVDIFTRDARDDSHELDFTEDGIRRKVRLGGSLSQVGLRLLEPENETVVKRIDSEIRRRREELGDRQFVTLLLKFRNSWYDTITDSERRKKQFELLDAYIRNDRGLDEARVQVAETVNQPSAMQPVGSAASPAPSGYAPARPPEIAGTAPASTPAPPGPAYSPPAAAPASAPAPAAPAEEGLSAREPTPAGSDEILKQIEKLGELRDRGILSEEDFQRKK